MVNDDTKLFPIQAEDGRNQGRASTIPWWLAEIAYKEYSRRFGDDQSLECLAGRGGFGRKELVVLLRGKLLETGIS